MTSGSSGIALFSTTPGMTVRVKKKDLPHGTGQSGKFQNGQILHLKTEIRNLKMDEIRGQAHKADKTSARPHFVRFEIS